MAFCRRSQCAVYPQNINLLVADAIQLRRRSCVDVRYCRHAFSRCQCFNVHNATFHSRTRRSMAGGAPRTASHYRDHSRLRGGANYTQTGHSRGFGAGTRSAFAAAMFSGALIGSKMLTATENPNAMVFYLYTLMIPPAAIGAAFGWTNPVIADLPLLTALGICTVGAQQCQTRAFRAAPASLVVVINYVQLPLIALFGWLFFSQSTDIWTWAGAAVICTSTYYVSYREGRQNSELRKGKFPSSPA